MNVKSKSKTKKKTKIHSYSYCSICRKNKPFSQLKCEKCKQRLRHRARNSGYLVRAEAAGLIKRM